MDLTLSWTCLNFKQDYNRVYLAGCCPEGKPLFI
jgi:hypothetical protein